MRYLIALFLMPLMWCHAKEPLAIAEIQVIDAETKRGVPLIELTTVNEILFVTDNAGRIAINDPDLLNREVFFSVRGHGYEVPKDGFGIQGVRVVLRPNQPIIVKVNRTTVAERIARLTGTGTWRDSELLGHAVPKKSHAIPGNVAGQDSVQTAVYHGKRYWFWGDTNQLKYPLGLYRTAGATTKINLDDPANGFDYAYFTNKDGFARAMMPLPERPDGVIWIFGVCTVRDGTRERLIGHYSRRQGLAKELEHGIAIFDDDKQIFTIAKQLPANEQWRFPKGSPLVVKHDQQSWLYFANPYPTVRVRATLEDVLNPEKYEAYRFTPGDKPTWAWQRDHPPTNTTDEIAMINTGKLPPQDAQFSPIHPTKRVPIQLHTGTLRWNEFRKKYIIVGCRMGGESSFLGEVWYTESDHLTGPFRTAQLLAQHDKQTFYNVVHHAFLDREQGQEIFFEGTYTNEFSGNPLKTPRYHYNQMLYRVDLRRLSAQSAPQ